MTLLVLLASFAMGRDVSAAWITLVGLLLGLEQVIGIGVKRNGNGK